MWEFIAYLVVTLLISYALRPKAQTPKPEAFEDIDFPRAEEGSPQCVIFGDCWVPDWAVIAVGNYRTVPIVQRGETTGFWYAFGFHMGVAKAVDELVEIQVGDKVLWRGSMTENGKLNFNAPDLFGGHEREGGIAGDFYMLFGDDDQVLPSDPQVTATLTPPSPDFIGRATAFFDGVVCARSPYPKPWKFRVRRITRGWDGDVWYPERAAIEIVRPVSAGETQGSTGGTSEVATVRASTPLRIVVDGGSGDLRVTLSGLAFLTVEEVWLWDGTAPLTLGLHYVIESGYIIHFADIGENLGGGVNTVEFDGLVAIVRYTYQLTTVLPPTVSTLGTTRIKAMNPAHMLYECYTNRIWGRGYPVSSLNLSAEEGGLTYLANRLFNEGFGLCYRWNRRGGIKSVIQTICDTIGCNVYTDRATGKISFKLMRGDYDFNTLPLFKHDTGLIEVSDSGVSTKEQAINEIVITYRDPVTNKDQPVRQPNLASMQATGGVANTQTIEMLAVPTAELASRVCKREMKGRTAALRKYEILLDRRGRSLVPGSLMRVVDLSRNIPDTVLRVGSVEYGPLGRGQIKVVGMKDVFSTPTSGFPTMPPPQSAPPGAGGPQSGASPCFDESVTFELPYRSLKRMIGPGDFSVVGASAAYLGYILSSGGPFNQTYDIAIKAGPVDTELELPPDDGYFCQLPDDPRAQKDLRIAYSMAGTTIKDLGISYVIASASGLYSPLSFYLDFDQSGSATLLTNAGLLGGTKDISSSGMSRSTTAPKYGTKALDGVGQGAFTNVAWDFAPGDFNFPVGGSATYGGFVKMVGLMPSETVPSFNESLAAIEADITYGVGQFIHVGAELRYYFGGSRSRRLYLSGETVDITDESYHHFEICIDASGTYTFLDGTLLAFDSGAKGSASPQSRFDLRYNNPNGQGPQGSWSLHLDQLYFVPGVCAHTTNFTPPAGPMV